MTKKQYCIFLTSVTSLHYPSAYAENNNKERKEKDKATHSSLLLYFSFLFSELKVEYW